MKVRATYRLQFHKGFTFADAARRAGYFAELGISHIYASPILAARAGSMHGYDVVDHSRINPELGGEEELRALSRALRNHKLGLIADIVPNHVAVGGADNAWWLDLLANGPSSRFASAFDIDWDAPGLEGKVLAPFLGDEPRVAIAKGELKLERDQDGLAFVYYGHHFPLRPQDQALDPRQRPEQLQELLGRQHFVLAHWREADRRINWRRFFDITDLAAIRVAEPDVFEAVHAKIFALYADGVIDGVRVDHVDGLADPAGYCRTLRRRLEAMRPGAIIYVEKILADGEALPADWQVDGTTGYDFLEQASAVLHYPDGGVLTGFWHAVSGRALSFDAEESLARSEILNSKFVSQLAACTRAFAPLLEQSQAATERLLSEVLIRLRCYRSYATGKPDTPGPGPYLSAAIASAKTASPDRADAFQALMQLFDRDDDDPAVVDALRRFAQLSAPLAAKSVEDTAFYRYGRQLSRNDVGTDPRRTYLSPADFHRLAGERAWAWPGAMLTTATHDHKRGEDARARLSVLSLQPALWKDFISSAPACPELAPADVYQLHQTLFGAWPVNPNEDFALRIEGWCRKFLREGKLRSSWSAPDETYENRFRAFARSLIMDRACWGYRNRLAILMAELQADIRRAVIVQLVLRNTVPGVPDLYQGCEFEDLSLVDPDNRRPVDFDVRQAALDGEKDEKQLVLKRLLAVRRRDADLWQCGSYEGRDDRNCIAFVRKYRNRSLSVWLQLGRRAETPIQVPAGTEILTHRTYREGLVQPDILFGSFPAAVIYAGA